MTEPCVLSVLKTIILNLLLPADRFPLLKENIFSIREISNSVGFEDPLYFSRAFKLVKGMSPRSWAALQREDGE